MIDDGGTDEPAGELWKQSLAQIVGTPPRISFSHVGDPKAPAPASFAQIKANHSLWTGPLGPYYSSGLVEADRILFATQENNWPWGTNGLFAGLAGIAYSTDLGQHWTGAGKPFPAPLGNLSWVQRGRGGNYVDGYVYAIATEREFNATNLIMGRSRPDVADMTDPAKWEWVSGWRRHQGLPWPVYSGALTAAVPIASWPAHITYPQMSYDAPLHHYLLTFTHSYGTQPPADLAVGLRARHPGRAASVGAVLVRGARDGLRALQRLRPRHPPRLDKPQRPPAVAEVGGQLRRLCRTGLLGRVRIQLSSGAARRGRPTGGQHGEHSKQTERSRDVRAGFAQ